MSGPIEIRQHEPGKGVKDFVRAGHVVFEGDPAWVPPLDLELGERLDPKKNPFFQHAEAALFTAWRDGALVGRVSASVDRSWLDTWNDHSGHFGFFDTIDDPEVARALLDAAESWLRARGMKRVIGPMSLGANEEFGLLIDGFEHPPNLMMAHSRRWQQALVEGCGYAKDKDVHAYRFDAATPLRQRSQKAWDEIRALPELKLRSIDPRKLDAELAVLLDVYNETWAGKWGFVPLTRAEMTKMAADLRLVIDPEVAFIAEIDGDPVGICLMVPNVNEAIADLRGKLFPFGWAKLLWRLKVRRPTSTRLIVLGVRERVRKNVKRYGALSTAMYVEVAKRGAAKGYRWSELSWIREDDAPISLGIRAMGGSIYKTYRVYQKPL